MGKLALANQRTRSRLAEPVPAAAGGYNYVTAVSWAHFYWFGGSVWQAQGVSDGATSFTVKDEIAAHAEDLASGAGTYRAAAAAMNGKPCFEKAGSGDGKYTTGIAGTSEVALPYSIITVFQLNSVSSPPNYVTDGANLGGTGQRILLRVSSGPVWSLYMGTDQTGGTPTTGIKAARIYATSGNDTLTVNGSTILSGVNSGGGNFQGLTWGGVAGAPISGRFAMWGIFPGDITAQGNWSAIQAAILSDYGVSLS